jgi:hypothetical protein
MPRATAYRKLREAFVAAEETKHQGGYWRNNREVQLKPATATVTRWRKLAIGPEHIGQTFWFPSSQPAASIRDLTALLNSEERRLLRAELARRAWWTTLRQRLQFIRDMAKETQLAEALEARRARQAGPG